MLSSLEPLEQEELIGKPSWLYCVRLAFLNNQEQLGMCCVRLAFPNNQEQLGMFGATEAVFLTHANELHSGV